MFPFSLAFLILTISYSLDAHPFQLHPKIVGGTPAIPKEFPYQVSLQAFNQLERSWDPICGGVIIDSTTILSAAHCVLYYQLPLNKDVTKFRVVAGEYDLKMIEGSEQERLVESVHPHPEWDSFKYRNDIGLYILSEPLMFNDWVQPMKLPPTGHISTGSATVIGWGSINEQGPIVTVLQKAEIDIHNSDDCREWFGDDFYERMICAGTLDGSIDACTGDSGGPLIANDLGYDYVAGIVSWGVGCGRDGFLGFYTKVSDFTDWIEDPGWK